jgi:integrase
MAKAGSESFADIRASDIEEGKDRRAETPAQARNFLDAMRGLFRWAVSAPVKHVSSDPTAGVRNPKKEATEGFKAWETEHVARYIARWPLGTRQYVWLRVLLHIGCRRGDAVMLGRQHVRNGVITFITEKGRKKERIEVTRRIDPELADAIAAGPCGDLAFVCGERGHPLTKESFGNHFKEACVGAGITDRSAHGLRKLSATTWAERGASEHELMALFGWLTPSMAALYTRKAERKKLSLNVHDRLAVLPVAENAN